MTKKISGIQSGVSGEYFVAAELSRRGYLCSITLKNTKGVDVLVSNESSSRLLGVQVKTNNGERKAWLINKKAEKLSEDNLVYVFVNLKKLNELPEFYIVPSKVVAKQVEEGHEEWLHTSAKSGKKHKDTSMRMFRDPDDKFKDKWDIIEELLG